MTRPRKPTERDIVGRNGPNGPPPAPWLPRESEKASIRARPYRGSRPSWPGSNLRRRWFPLAARGPEQAARALVAEATFSFSRKRDAAANLYPWGFPVLFLASWMSNRYNSIKRMQKFSWGPFIPEPRGLAMNWGLSSWPVVGGCFGFTGFKLFSIRPGRIEVKQFYEIAFYRPPENTTRPVPRRTTRRWVLLGSRRPKQLKTQNWPAQYSSTPSGSPPCRKTAMSLDGPFLAFSSPPSPPPPPLH